MVHEIKKEHDVPIVLLSYYNPIFKMGLNNFFESAKRKQVDGIIIPDLPIEEDYECHSIAEKNGVDMIFLASPATTIKRLKKIIEQTSGFLYLVSHYGTTGSKEKIDDSTISLIKKCLPFTRKKIPLSVGFGISNPNQVKRVINAGADGVIVGSAFINLIEKRKK